MLLCFTVLLVGLATALAYGTLLIIIEEMSLGLLGAIFEWLGLIILAEPFI